MILSINSFKTYIKSQSTSLRIASVNNHKLKGKIISTRSNKLQIDFGHCKNSKITSSELYQCFKYNRRVPLITNQADLLNNKINFIIKEVTPQESPVLQNQILKPRSKNFTSKLNSLTQLKRAFVFKKLVHGRIIKKIRGGFLVILLGFFAFLPTSHFVIDYRNKQYKNLNIKKTKLLFTKIPLEILGIKCLKSKSIYNKSDIFFLNIVVSFRKALKTLEKHHKMLNTKKLTRIIKLKNYKNLKYTQ